MRDPAAVASTDWLEDLLEAAGDASQREKLLSRLAELAFQDPLTGLANRRALEERLDAAVTHAASFGGEVALLFCDLDSLKELNDADGHEAGDAALVQVAEALRAAAEPIPGAFISRIGGDEFCVLIEGHGAERARELALDAERRLDDPASPRRLTLSCGASELQHAGQRPADLFRAADAAQYVAKRAGRGRVYVAEAGAVALAGAAAGPARGRRRLRDAGPTAGLLEGVLELLDGELARASAQDRLEGVAVAFADAFDASGWALSWQPPGDDMVRTLFEGGRRAHRVSGVPSLRFSGSNDIYPLADYPVTAAIMEHGGSFCQRVDDPDGDPAEQALLRRAGHESLVAAAAVDAGGAWLVELYADARSGALEHARAELRLLLGEALRVRA
jgi:diguanylate cyclase (GGDEF)-like protein